MVHKSKKKGRAPSSGCNADVEIVDLPELEEARGLLDELRIAEALEAVGRGLERRPEAAGALLRLRGMAEEMQAYFHAADGIHAEARLEEAALRVGGGGVAPRGRGLVTTRAFKCREVLFRERPLLVAPRRLATLGAAESVEAFDTAAVLKAYHELSEVQRRLLLDFEAAMEGLPAAFVELLRSQPELEPAVRLARAMRLNAHECPTEPDKAGLYVLIARANHSCNPTCGLASAPGGGLLFYALRDMEAGEEIDYSYLGGHFTLHPPEVRREQLLRTKLFECRCPRCGAGGGAGEEAAAGAPDGSVGPEGEEAWDEQRLAQYRRLEPLLANKVTSLEAAWQDPGKDPTKYINDWEILAKKCLQMLGQQHATSARACFFALQALNTGLCMGVGGVDAARHATGVKALAVPLARYLQERCPLGARRVSLEPIGRALIALAQRRAKGELSDLAVALLRATSADDLRCCFYDEALNATLARVVDDAFRELSRIDGTEEEKS